ncbi:MAG: hypothetical protein ACQEQS_05595 [Thermodesulfobacteriota bacterium]
MNNGLKLFFIISAGFILFHCTCFISIYHSNSELFAKAVTVFEQNYFFFTPCCYAAENLKSFSAAFFSAFFFTFTAGLIIVLFPLILGLLYNKGTKKLKISCIILIFFFTLTQSVFLKSLWLLALPSLAVFYLTLKFKPVFRFNFIFLIPAAAVLIIMLAYKGNSFFLDTRDKILLTNSAGKKINKFYYKYTLYPAELIKTPFAKKLKTSDLQGFSSINERKKTEKLLNKFNYFTITNNNIKADLSLKKTRNSIKINSGKYASKLSYSDLYNQSKDIFKKISEKNDNSEFLRKITIAGFICLLFFSIYCFTSALNFFFNFINHKKIQALVSAGVCTCILLIISAPLMQNADITKKNVLNKLDSDNRFTRLEALKFAGKNNIDIPAPEKHLNSDYTAERYWAVLNFKIKNIKDLLKIFKKTRDESLNIKCTAYKKLGGYNSDPRFKNHIKKFLIDNYPEIKDWYVQWYAYTYNRNLFLK